MIQILRNGLNIFLYLGTVMMIVDCMFSKYEQFFYIKRSQSSHHLGMHRIQLIEWLVKGKSEPVVIVLHFFLS